MLIALMWHDGQTGQTLTWPDLKQHNFVYAKPQHVKHNETYESGFCSTVHITAGDSVRTRAAGNSKLSKHNKKNKDITVEGFNEGISTDKM